MKLEVLSINGEKVGDVEFPKEAIEEIREDLIKLAVLSSQANARQKYGAKEDAGMRHSAKLSRRRRKYKTSYGHGISRVPRKIMSKSGTRFNWVGAVAPGTVGGRKAHAPKAEKNWGKKMNAKEKLKAVFSALNVVFDKTRVLLRGHKVPEKYPFLIEDKFEKLNRAKEVKDALVSLGFKEEIVRAKEKKIRAGKGKSRARPYKKKKGLLLVVSEKCSALNAAKNIAGVEVCISKNLNTEYLAPGTSPGRATLFTKKAFEEFCKKRKK